MDMGDKARRSFLQSTDTREGEQNVSVGVAVEVHSAQNLMESFGDICQTVNR